MIIRLAKLLKRLMLNNMFINLQPRPECLHYIEDDCEFCLPSLLLIKDSVSPPSSISGLSSACCFLIGACLYRNPPKRHSDKLIIPSGGACWSQIINPVHSQWGIPYLDA